MIAEAGLDALIQGYRGKRAKDKDGLVDFLVSISRFAYDYRGCLIELDLNPVMLPEKEQGRPLVVDIFARFH
jgi:hypothetical protein